jgi:hypothetical protein
MRRFLHRLHGETAADRRWSLHLVLSLCAFSFAMAIVGLLLGLRCSGHL